MWRGPRNCQKSLFKPTVQGCCQIILGWTSIKTQESWPEIHSCLRQQEKSRCEMYSTLTFPALVNFFRRDFDSVGALALARCISKHIKQSRPRVAEMFTVWQHDPWTATITNVQCLDPYDVYTIWLLFFPVWPKWCVECITALMWKEKQSLPHPIDRVWLNLAVFWWTSRFVWHKALQYVSMPSANHISSVFPYVIIFPLSLCRFDAFVVFHFPSEMAERALFARHFFSLYTGHNQLETF